MNKNAGARETRIASHPSFKEIVEKNKASEKEKNGKFSNYALVLAVVANVVDILSFFILPQSFGAMFVALRGLHVVTLFLIALFLGIWGLRGQKTRAISIIAIVIDIVALWPFIVYDWSGPLFVF